MARETTSETTRETTRETTSETTSETMKGLEGPVVEAFNRYRAPALRGGAA